MPNIEALTKGPIDTGASLEQKKQAKIMPWVEMILNPKDHGIPIPTIYKTAGLAFKCEAAERAPLTHGQETAIKKWRAETTTELVKHLFSTPRSIEVYRSLREDKRVIPLHLIEILDENLH